MWMDTHEATPLPMDQNDDALILGRAVQLLIQDRKDEARQALAHLSIADPIVPPAFATSYVGTGEYVPRPSVNASILAPIFARDGWRCQYCGRRLVASPIIEIIGTLCPEEFPFPAGHHMPRDRTHPAAIRVYPEVDHVHPGSLGGDWRAETNLITACEPCNMKKSNRVGWSVGTFARNDWDGLVPYYRALVTAAGNTRDYHRGWLRAFNV